MNDTWGQFPEDGWLVYARTGYPFPKIETPAVALDELRPQPEGTLAMLPIRKEFDGRIDGFGSRFWSAVEDRCGPLKDQLEQGGPITEVCYSDRYVSSPWALLLIREVLLDLVRRERADSGTAFQVFTRELRGDGRPIRDGLSIGDAWPDDDVRESFFMESFRVGRGHLQWEGPLAIETGPAPHFRELRLNWADGVAWTLKLDQGVGYWRCRPSAGFPFGRKASEQLQSFNDIAAQCRATSRGVHPTYIYVAPASKE